MEEYSSNSYKVKAMQEKQLLENQKPEKKVEKIVNGTVKTKKKNEFRKFADTFISEDAQNVKSYIFMDVLIPTIKKAISDVIKNGIDMILYGESGRSSRGSGSIASKVSYRSYYDRENDIRSYRTSSVRASGYDFDDLIFDNRGEAEAVLDRMEEILSMYGLVSVADLYDLVGITERYTDNNYGWTDIRNANIIRVRDGYLLKLPKALPLN